MWALKIIHEKNLRVSLVLSFQLDTDSRLESIPHKSSLAPVSLSLDTVIVGEVDELEEDGRQNGIFRCEYADMGISYDCNSESRGSFWKR